MIKKTEKLEFSIAHKMGKHKMNSIYQKQIDKEFKNIDRETFKQQLKEAMKNLTADYEVGLKKGRKLSVNRPVAGAQAPKKISKS